MKFIATTILNENQKTQIVDLWNNEYPKKLRHENYESFETYLKNLKEQTHILLINKESTIIGWYFNFIREDEKWFAMILNSKIQGKGLGTRLLNKAKRDENELNGWVIDCNNYIKENGEFYQSPINFYEKNNFKIIKEIRLELDAISAVKIKWEKCRIAAP